jgi:hypothetical protein
MLWKLWLAGAAAGVMLTGVVAGAGSAAGKPAEAAGAPELAGIRWEPDLEAAKAKARREGKPIFLLHLMGRLDEEFC